MLKLFELNLKFLFFSIQAVIILINDTHDYTENHTYIFDCVQ